MAYVFKKLSSILIGIMISVLCFAAIGEAQIEEEKAKERERKRAMIRAAKEKLNGTSWEITLTESTAKKNKEVIEDTLRFVNGRIESKNLVSEGFSPSNYTVRIKRENRVIWETMQKGEEKGIAFWRGELDRDQKDGALGEVMRGVLSWHVDDEGKKVVDYTFISEGVEEVMPTEVEKGEAPIVEEVPTVGGTQEAAEVPIAAIEEPVKEEATEEKAAEVKPKKEEPKKKRWWQR